MDGYAEFFLAVANGHERQSLQYRREEFRRKYGLLFPSNTIATFETQRRAYHEARGWWVAPTKDIPIEQPDTEYGLHVVTLRHKLRVIWVLADSGDMESAEEKCKDLYVDVHRYLRGGAQDRPFEPWRVALENACQVDLLKIIGNLKLCENPICNKEPYFIRHGRARYCCTACNATAKQIRLRERDALKPLKEYKMSPEARERMAIKRQRYWDKRKGEFSCKNRGPYSSR